MAGCYDCLNRIFCGTYGLVGEHDVIPDLKKIGDDAEEIRVRIANNPNCRLRLGGDPERSQTKNNPVYEVLVRISLCSGDGR